MNGKILEEVYNRNAPYSDRIRIPFLFQGQYYDHETELAYNRFRYYSPETGAYISQDPIRLEAGLTNQYAYVHDVNAWIAPWGLRSFTQAVGDIGEKYMQDLLKKQGVDLVDVKYGSNNGIDILTNLGDFKVIHVTLQRRAKGRLYAASHTEHKWH